MVDPRHGSHPAPPPRTPLPCAPHVLRAAPSRRAPARVTCLGAAASTRCRCAADRALPARARRRGARRRGARRLRRRFAGRRRRSTSDAAAAAAAAPPPSPTRRAGSGGSCGVVFGGRSPGALLPVGARRRVTVSLATAAAAAAAGAVAAHAAGPRVGVGVGGSTAPRAARRSTAGPPSPSAAEGGGDAPTAVTPETRVGRRARGCPRACPPDVHAVAVRHAWDRFDRRGACVYDAELLAKLNRGAASSRFVSQDRHEGKYVPAFGSGSDGARSAQNYCGAPPRRVLLPRRRTPGSWGPGPPAPRSRAQREPPPRAVAWPPPACTSRADGNRAAA